MMQRLITYWVYGGVLAGGLLLILAPVLTAGWAAPLVATFLHLPAYMIHQYEEHDDDRFRLFFNETIGQGHDVLSPMALFITNVPGVWGVIALALIGAATLHLGWALLAAYLVLVNAFVHIVHAFIFRRYNPGLATAVVLFIPLGGWTLHLVAGAGGAPLAGHLGALGLVVVLHAAILVHVRRRLHRLQQAQAMKAPTKEAGA